MKNILQKHQVHVFDFFFSFRDENSLDGDWRWKFIFSTVIPPNNKKDAHNTSQYVVHSIKQSQKSSLQFMRHFYAVLRTICKPNSWLFERQSRAKNQFGHPNTHTPSPVRWGWERNRGMNHNNIYWLMRPHEINFPFGLGTQRNA